MKKSLIRKLSQFLTLAMILSMALYSCQNPFAGTGGAEPPPQSRAVSSQAYTDFRAPSQNPPGGLQPKQVPQFVILGYDDNQYADGMMNVLDVYRNRNNPAGANNPLTFDGSPTSVSFYVVPSGKDAATGETWMTDDDAITTWKLAYQMGHEIGNHTWDHASGGLSRSAADWDTEITRAQEFITSRLGIPSSEVVGFRTPFLEYNTNTFNAMKKNGLTYDVSFEGGWRYWPAEDGSTLFWPYTMDNGKPAGEDGREFGKQSGIWEIPDDCVFFPGGRTTGLDYNLWFSKSTTKQEFVDILKYSLDKKYNGNRSPMNFGLHSNYYSLNGDAEMKKYDAASYAKLKANVSERTAALKEFLDYALTLPDVRVVSAKQALEWIRNPVALGSSTVKQYVVTATAGSGGDIAPSGKVNVIEGSTKDFYINPQPGYFIDSVVVDGVNKGAVRKITLSDVRAAHTITASFRTPSTENARKSSILSMTAIAENSQTTLKFDYAENINDGRGITFGIVGFTSGTWDGTIFIERLKAKNPAHPLVSYLPAFKAIDALPHPDGKTGVTTGLENFIADFTRYGNDADCHAVQLSLLDELYYNTAYAKYLEIGARNPITMGFLYDTCVNHGAYGEGTDKGLEVLVAEASAAAGGTPKSGVNETVWLNKLIDARRAYMMSDPTWKDAIDRVNMYKTLLDSGNVNLTNPFTVSCYDESFTIYGSEILMDEGTVQRYDIVASAGTGGSISPSGTLPVSEGSGITYYISPSEGYAINDVKVDGLSVGAVDSYIFTNVKAGHTIAASFKAGPPPVYFNLTVASPVNGTLSPSGIVSVKQGASQTFTLSPASGYQVDRVLVDDQAVALTGNSFTVANVQKSMAVEASFKKVDAPVYPAYDPAKVYNTGDIVSHLAKYWIAGWWTQGAAPGSTGEWGVWKEYQPVNVNTYTLTSSAGANGSISPAGASLVNEGASQTFTMNPASGYMVEDVKVDGVSVGAVASYTLSNVKKNSTVVVTFKTEPVAVYWTLTASAGANGTISPAGASQVKEGSNKTFTFSPASGYEVASVTVDGSPVAVAASYTFNNVRKASSIAVSFKVKTIPDVEAWVENKAYSLNDKVSHAGSTWICKYAHTSNSAWVPGTPGLWMWEKI